MQAFPPNSLPKPCACVKIVRAEANMHEGHRSRMYQKLKNGDNLFEHELLEMLLFNAFPRKNTNPVAHALLKAFGSIRGVLSAEVEELCAVEGVGESVALYLKCIGKCTEYSKTSADVPVAVLKSYEDFKRFVMLRMRGKTQEILELYCLEKSGRIKRIFTFTTNEQSRVEVNSDRVAKAIATVKPYGILIAHNHLSGTSQPSENDDRFTMAVQLMCSMNNVNLQDHCIYASDSNIYSYFFAGKIDKIKNNYSFEKLVDGQFKKDKAENPYKP